MKKKVNGHVVDIPNMDTIEKGFEGLATGRLVSSNISDNLTEGCEDIINECIAAYESVCKALPFPLHAVEENIKYAAIGSYIKDKLRKPLEMWVDRSLYILVDKTRALKFASNTWGVVSVDGAREDNTSIELYRYDVGYNEFEWALEHLMNGEPLTGYYQRFMSGFVKACENEPLVLKWEMSRLLDFGYVPPRMDLNNDKLLDVHSGFEYFLDIFSAGERKTGGCRCVIDLTKKGSTPVIEDKTATVYDFEVYEKRKLTPEDMMATPDVKRIQRTGMDGLAAVFQTVMGKGAFSKERPGYKGIIDKGVVVYEVAGTVYRCGTSKYQKAVVIARNVELWGYENGCVYLKQTVACPSGVRKESIYAYRISDGATLICKIAYE